MDLSTLGTICVILYCIFIFTFQWVTDWYFNVTPSPTLDYIRDGLKELYDET